MRVIRKSLLAFKNKQNQYLRITKNCLPENIDFYKKGVQNIVLLKLYVGWMGYAILFPNQNTLFRTSSSALKRDTLLIC